MNYVATIIFSTLSLRWPLAGIVSFLLAYTGMAGFFEELGILGMPVGGVRPDTIAIVVSIIVLLRRPPTIKIPDIITASLWIITCTVPVGMFFMSPSMYDFLANSWRVFFWAPTFLALLRLSEKEWHILGDTIILLLAINGLLVFYILQTGDHGLFRRLSINRLLTYDQQSIVAAMSVTSLDTLRLTLPGTFTFGSLAVFLCFNRVFSSDAFMLKRAGYFVLQIFILYSLYLTLVRTTAIAMLMGGTLILVLVLLRSRAHQKMYATGLLLILVLILSIFIAQYSGAARAWQDRVSGSADGYDSMYVRLENNLLYWDILTHSPAIIGHPDFEAADIAVGGYHDVVAPLAIWWYFGLVAAFCYCLVIVYYIWYGASLLARDIPAHQRLPLFATAGMFLDYLIENLSGPVPFTFDFAFTFSFVLSFCASMIFPKISVRLPRTRKFFRV